MISFLKNGATLREIYQYKFEPEYRDQFATLYWYALLSIVSAGVLTIVWIGSTQFMDILKELEITPHATREAISLPLDKNELKAYVAIYKEKQARFDSYQTIQLNSPPDPSK